MSRDKISRKKLLQEPDEFLSLSQRVVLWVHDNQKRTVSIAGGVVAVVLLAVLVKVLVTRSHEKRAAELSAAVTAAEGAAAKAPADRAREFARLAESYRGATEGLIARYFEAGAHVSAGDAEAGRRIYGELAASAADPEIAALSALGLAYLDLSQGSLDAARAAFEGLLKLEAAAVPRAQVMLEIAQIHEKQGRSAEALRVYREIAAAHPDGSWAAVVKERVRLLGERESAAS